MNFRLKLGLIIAVGLILGLAARSYLAPQQERAAAAINLFQDICVPFSKREETERRTRKSGLMPVGLDQNWADPDSKFVLEIGALHCATSDTLLRLTKVEQDRFEASLVELVEHDFPMLGLVESDGPEDWNVFQHWSQYDEGDDRNWGILLSRNSSEEGPEDRLFDRSHTVLRISIAKQ